MQKVGKKLRYTGIRMLVSDAVECYIVYENAMRWKTPFGRLKHV